MRRLRPEVDAIVPRDATIVRIATGFQFTEGPVWHPDGYLLFSDPNANTIYRWSPDGQVSVFRPKSGYAYVDDWDVSRKVILRYPVRADGSLGAGAVFADVTRSDPGEQAWDGLEVDTEGHVYAAGPGGIWIFAPDGTQLGTISPPETPANFAWGDADGRTLYITARTSLYRIRLSVPGIRPWPAPSAQTAQTAQTAQRTRTSP